MIMQGLDIARNAIGEFQFHEFRMLRELHLSVTPDGGNPVIDVEMCLATESRQPPARLCLRFHQVSSLQIRDLSGEARIQGFDIADLSDRQLENISWQVFDFEDGVIRFYAKDAEITSASIIGSSGDSI